MMPHSPRQTGAGFARRRSCASKQYATVTRRRSNQGDCCPAGRVLDSHQYGMEYGIPNGTGKKQEEMTAKGSEPLIDSVYGRLRDMILANVLRSGQKLVDRDLAEQLGVSRTPVREALGRLAMMGLVEARSRRGYYVRQYTARDVVDIYQFRRILEVSAARLAAQNARPEHVEKFKHILVELDTLTANPSNLTKSVELDLQIHNLIAEASGNALLRQTIRNLMDKVMCFIWVDWLGPRSAVPETTAAAHREHQDMITKIMEKDPDGAAESLGAHIDHARESLEGVLRAREDLQSAVLLGGPPT
jgi:DNA-binding GntR family transcriptional regulator